MTVPTYRMYRLWRLQALVMFTAFAMIGIAGLIVSAVSGSRAGFVFVLIWLMIVAWNAYWFLLRVAFRLELTDRDLRWTAPLRRGSVRLTELVEIRPQRFGSNLEVLVCTDGSKIPVLVRKGFIDFMDDVQSAAPHVNARVGAFARIGNRLPGPRGYRRVG